MIIRELIEKCGTEQMKIQPEIIKFVLRLMMDNQKVNRVQLYQEPLGHSKKYVHFYSGPQLVTNQEYDIKKNLNSFPKVSIIVGPMTAFVTRPSTLKSALKYVVAGAHVTNWRCLNFYRQAKI